VPALGIPAFVVPNDSAYLSILAPLALGSALAPRASRATRILAGASLVATAAGVAAAGSRGAVVTLAVGCGVAAAPLGRRAALLALAAASAALAIDALQGFALVGKFATGVDPRLSLWWIASRMFLDAPWLGHGPYTYGLLYGEYLSRGAPGWMRLDPHEVVPWAHDLYLEVLAERGLLGFAAFLWMGIAAGIAIQRSLRGANPALRARGSGVRGALAGFLVLAVFESSFVRIWVAVVFFALLGMVERMSDKLPNALTPEERPR
jgi:O-antigen ligase